MHSPSHAPSGTWLNIVNDIFLRVLESLFSHYHYKPTFPKQAKEGECQLMQVCLFGVQYLQVMLGKAQLHFKVMLRDRFPEVALSGRT